MTRFIGLFIIIVIILLFIKLGNWLLDGISTLITKEPEVCILVILLILIISFIGFLTKRR